jgi:hypothetical protein
MKVLAWFLWRVAGLPGTADDPFGPVEQDPDQIRNEACRLVSSDRSCSAPSPPKAPSNPPHLAWLETLLRVLVLGLLAAVVVAAVYVIVRSLTGHRPQRRRRGRRQVHDADTVEVLGRVTAIDRSREPGDWRHEADEHRRAGRFRDALRCRYRALVGDLARGGVIDEIPGRTSGEERTQMHAARPHAAPRFDDAADLFDAAWFGDLDVADADVDAMEQWERAVLASVAAVASVASVSSP